MFFVRRQTGWLIAAPIELDTLLAGERLPFDLGVLLDRLGRELRNRNVDEHVASLD